MRLRGEAGASGSALFWTADSASGFFSDSASMVVGALDGLVFFAFGLVAAFLTPAAAAFFDWNGRLTLPSRGGPQGAFLPASSSLQK